MSKFDEEMRILKEVFSSGRGGLFNCLSSVRMAGLTLQINLGPYRCSGVPLGTFALNASSSFAKYNSVHSTTYIDGLIRRA